MDQQNPYKNLMGRRYLRALFFEEVGEDKSTVLYTLKRDDHNGFPSLYRLYMLCDDPTEYTFACDHLDGWSHWMELSNQAWFKPYVEEWRHEMEVRVRARSLKAIMDVAADKANTSSYYANKYLLDGSWKPADAKKRGRPSPRTLKDEIIAHGASLADFEDDAKRLGIN